MSTVVICVPGGSQCERLSVRRTPRPVSSVLRCRRGQTGRCPSPGLTRSTSRSPRQPRARAARARHRGSRRRGAGHAPPRSSAPPLSSMPHRHHPRISGSRSRVFAWTATQRSRSANQPSASSVQPIGSCSRVSSVRSATSRCGRLRARVGAQHRGCLLVHRVKQGELQLQQPPARVALADAAGKLSAGEAAGLQQQLRELGDRAHVVDRARRPLTQSVRDEPIDDILAALGALVMALRPRVEALQRLIRTRRGVRPGGPAHSRARAASLGQQDVEFELLDTLAEALLRRLLGHTASASPIVSHETPRARSAATASSRTSSAACTRRSASSTTSPPRAKLSA